MCTTNLYTYVHQDGSTEQTYQPALCSASRHGQPCVNEVVFQHPLQYLSYDTSPFATLPPTPNYTPRSSTPNYRSGDDSDRSHHSTSSSKKRSSGVYVNGKKVLDLERKDRNRSSHRDHIVVVDPPRTPPSSSWTTSRSAPSSPNTYAIDNSSRASSSRRRSVVFDDHPQVQIEVVDAAPRSNHSRHASTSSRDSRFSDEEKQRRRQKRLEEKEREEAEIRQQRIRARIAEANAEINGRPAVPAAPAPRRRASTYKRGAVEVRDAETDLIDAVRRLDFEEARREEKARRLAKKEAEKEEEAQRQRLKDRMTRRRSSVSHTQRPYSVYDMMY